MCPMNADDPEFDPDDNFANHLQADADIDPEADDTPEALVWQLLLLINPGDEESALQQFAEYRDALAESAPDEVQPVWLLKDVIDWKAGFYVDGTDAVSFIDTITELAARWNLRIDWGVEDASDEDFLADADVPSLMAVAYDRLREYGYSLWTWNTANGPSGDEDMQAGWITLSSDDEAMQELAHALDIELRPGSDPFH
ncbi:hypothetical protein N792_12185 [Lysobacter concretionis Ko07 = DSM 16239]|uniref:DUF6630 domain-containing protein n=1 Tax=Lysobacter concretionis Ko07 = DSM 16239 TaxID=1122185 RepID=A0A0A0EPM1_9GAMM|nr:MULTISPECIES: hypothetical protein [Lysobacter]KGM51142.1 hypothetical protein N792_12185 [Lysobacter concretionis Ko07 = DSM 16239]QOD90870.1 hypothetical protein H2514_11950 [Lysobacter sp. CW239]